MKVFSALLVLSCLATLALAQPEAINPVVVFSPSVNQAVVLAGSSKGDWVSVDAVLKSWVKPKMLDFYAPGPGAQLSAKPGNSKNCPVGGVVFERTPSRLGVATAASWNPLPRHFEDMALDSVLYRTVMAGVLRPRGVVAQQVELSQLIRADIDGDYVDEVFVVATNYPGASLTSPPSTGKIGQYAQVVMRRLNGLRLETVVLGTSLGSNQGKPAVYAVVSVLDFNGDRKSEVVLAEITATKTDFRLLEWGGKEFKTVASVSCMNAQ